MEKLNKFIARLGKIINWVMFTLLVAMVIVIFIQVVARYIFKKGWPWTDEIGRYLMIYFTLLSAGPLLIEKGHVSITLLDAFFSKKVLYIINIIRYVLVLFFALFVMTTVPSFLKLGATSVSSNIGWPQNYLYIVVPIAYILIVFYSIACLIRVIKYGDVLTEARSFEEEASVNE